MGGVCDGVGEESRPRLSAGMMECHVNPYCFVNENTETEKLTSSAEITWLGSKHWSHSSYPGRTV